MPARHGNHVKAKSKKIQDEAKALGFHGVCTFGKICNKRDCALYHPAGWLKGPDEDEPIVIPPAAEAVDITARRSRRVVSEGAVNPNFLLAEQKKQLREERIAQNAGLVSGDLLGARDDGHRRTRKASQRLSETIDDDSEPPKKTEDLDAVRRVQEKLAAKKEQQQREREAERAAEEAKNAEREQERERLKQEKQERRDRLKAEREEAKAKGPEEYERWRQARRTMSCNSETGEVEVELPQLYPNALTNSTSESISSIGNGSDLADTDITATSSTFQPEPPQDEDEEMSFHAIPPQQPVESEFMTNYTNEPMQYPWQPQVRARAPPGIPQQTPWTCGCSFMNTAAALSCVRCGVFRFQSESGERTISFLAMDQPHFGSSSFQQQPGAVGPFGGGWGKVDSSNGSKHGTHTEPSRSVPPPGHHHPEGPEHMTRSHSTQAPFPHQQAHNGNGLLAPSRFPGSDSGAMFRHFDHGLGNGVFEPPPAVDRSHFAVAAERPSFRTVDELLESLNLSCLSSIFSSEDIDLAALKLLKNSHLTDMGIKLGPRVKLMKAIESL